MNILFYHKCVIDPQLGGISKITYTLANIFRTYNHNVWFLSENENKKNDNTNIQFVLPNRNLITEENIVFFYNILKKYNIDVVINQNALSAESSSFVEICKSKFEFKLVSCFHNSILTPIYNFALQKEYILKKKHLSFLFKLLKTRVLKSILTRIYISKHRHHYLKAVESSDAVVSLCDGLRDELSIMIGKLCLEKHYVIPNCVLIPEESVFEKQKEVLWVGTFDNSIKRPDVMLDVWKKISGRFSDWTLIFLGDGPSFVEMKSLAERYKISNIKFEGRVDPENFYKKAKILCLTSTHESFSLVTVEAKNHGVVPIIMNTFPAAKLIVENGVNGVLVDSYNIEKYTQNLIELMSNTDKLKKMSDDCINSRNQYSPLIVYKLWSKLFSEFERL